MIPHKLNPLGVDRLLDKYFNVIINITSNNLNFSFIPYFEENGFCRVMDWGDNQRGEASTSGEPFTHRYLKLGTYTVKIYANCYRIKFGSNDINTYQSQIINTNENWDALGNITDGTDMFFNCVNAQLDYSTLPIGLVTADGMFRECFHAIMNKLDMIPSSVTSAVGMFDGCVNAGFENLEVLGLGITDATRMFKNCNSAKFNNLKIISPCITTAESMFEECRNAEMNQLSGELGQNITNSIRMFYDCGNIKLNQCRLGSSLVDSSYMFYNCGKLELNNQYNLPDSCINIDYIFYGCDNLKMVLDRFGSNLRLSDYAFSGSSLKCDIRDLYIYTNTYPEFTNVDYMFSNCYNVTGNENLFFSKWNNYINVKTMFSGSGTTHDSAIIKVFSEVYPRYAGVYLLSNSANTGTNRYWINDTGLYAIRYNNTRKAWELIIVSTEQVIFTYSSTNPDPVSGIYLKEEDYEPLLEVVWGLSSEDESKFFELYIQTTNNRNYSFLITYSRFDDILEIENSNNYLITEDRYDLYLERNFLTVIYWGDGTYTTYVGSSSEQKLFRHTYELNKRYTIKIRGYFYSIDFYNNDDNNAKIPIGSNFLWEPLSSDLGRIVFKNCTNMNFENMNSLPNTLFDAHESFSGCNQAQFNSLVELPDSLENADYMFYDCTNARFNSLVSLGDGLKSANYAFYNCKLIKLSNVTKLSDYLLTANHMFDQCSELVMNNLTTLGDRLVEADYMFNECSNLNSDNISFGYNLVNANYMFNQCTKETFTNLTRLPDTLRYANYMFYNCIDSAFNRLTTLGNSLVEANYMFYHCYRSLFDRIPNIPDTIKQAEYMFAEDNNALFGYLTSVGDQLENAVGMFLNCSNANFERLNNFGNNIKYATYMFKNCRKAVFTHNEADLPDSMINGEGMFNYCGNINDNNCLLIIDKLPKKLENGNNMFEHFGGECNVTTINS